MHHFESEKIEYEVDKNEKIGFKTAIFQKTTPVYVLTFFETKKLHLKDFSPAFPKRISVGNANY